jgi:hypothetical protein
MAKIQRMRPAELKELRDLLAALKAMPDYAPHDPNATAASLEARLAAWDAANTVEVQKENETAAARDATAHLEDELRGLRSKSHTQVAAQYGKDSNQYAALGLVKESEVKRRGPNRPKPTA